jgi:hypothetical protein
MENAFTITAVTRYPRKQADCTLVGCALHDIETESTHAPGGRSSEGNSQFRANDDDPHGLVAPTLRLRRSYRLIDHYCRPNGWSRVMAANGAILDATPPHR